MRSVNSTEAAALATAAGDAFGATEEPREAALRLGGRRRQRRGQLGLEARGVLGVERILARGRLLLLRRLGLRRLRLRRGVLLRRRDRRLRRERRSDDRLHRRRRDRDRHRRQLGGDRRRDRRAGGGERSAREPAREPEPERPRRERRRREREPEPDGSGRAGAGARDGALGERRRLRRASRPRRAAGFTEPASARHP